MGCSPAAGSRGAFEGSSVTSSRRGGSPSAGVAQWGRTRGDPEGLVTLDLEAGSLICGSGYFLFCKGLVKKVLTPALIPFTPAPLTCALLCFSQEPFSTLLFTLNSDALGSPALLTCPFVCVQCQPRDWPEAQGEAHSTSLREMLTSSKAHAEMGEGAEGQACR